MWQNIHTNWFCDICKNHYSNNNDHGSHHVLDLKKSHDKPLHFTILPPTIYLPSLYILEKYFI